MLLVLKRLGYLPKVMKSCIPLFTLLRLENKQEDLDSWRSVWDIIWEEGKRERRCWSPDGQFCHSGDFVEILILFFFLCTRM